MPSYRYHRLALSDPRHRWWRPLLVGLVALLLHVGFLLVSGGLAVLVGTVVPAFRVAVEGFVADDLDPTSPLGLAVALGSVALVLPALLLATRLVGSRPVGLLSSVAGRLRWGWLGSTLLLALVVHVPAVALVVAVGGDPIAGPSVPPGTALVLLLTGLALVPLQAAAEEHLFRGYLVQLVGSWWRHPALAVVLPVPLFVLSHGYDLLGTVDVAAFALVCGWLAWRTGGLEAPIAVHVVNNLLLLTLDALGVSTTGAPRLGLAVSLLALAVYAVLVARRSDRLGVQRTRTRSCPATAVCVTAVGGDGNTSPAVQR